MTCPMTNENIKKYGLSLAHIRAFCERGCSVSCAEEFIKEFVEREK